MDLLSIPSGTITEDGMRINIDVGIQYMAAWLGGNGCVPIYNLMEDAATAEISRAQLWQWVHNPGTTLEDGREVTVDPRAGDAAPGADSRSRPRLAKIAV
jgi:malate synthase